MNAALPFAAPAAAAAGASSGATGIGQVTLSLALVLLAIFGCAWLARRLRGIGRGTRGVIEVLGDVALGPKERAVLLRVGGAMLLVGVAPGQVRTLHRLEGDAAGLVAASAAGATGAGAAGAAGGALPAGMAAAGGFRALLMRSLGR